MALPLIISMVELHKLRSGLAVSGTTSSTPTPTTPPSSASQPASSTPSPAPNSCLVSLIRTGCCCCCFFLPRIPALYHRCGLDVGPLCVHGDLQLRSHCPRPAQGAGDLRGIFAFLSNTSLSLHQPALEWPLLHLLHPSSRGHAAEAG